MRETFSIWKQVAHHSIRRRERLHRKEEKLRISLLRECFERWRDAHRERMLREAVSTPLLNQALTDQKAHYPIISLGRRNGSSQFLQYDASEASKMEIQNTRMLLGISHRWVV